MKCVGLFVLILAIFFFLHENTQESHRQLMLIYKLEEMSRDKYPEIQNEIFKFYENEEK